MFFICIIKVDKPRPAWYNIHKNTKGYCRVLIAGRVVRKCGYSKRISKDPKSARNGADFGRVRAKSQENVIVCRDNP